MKDKKMFIHFNTNRTDIYECCNEKIDCIEERQLFFNETLVNEELLKKLDMFLDELKEKYINIDNNNTRLCATGIFQELSKEEQNQIVIHVFVHSGLYLNIIPKDLENFYLENSQKRNGSKNLIEGLMVQEFRKVVICGSFQKNIKEITKIMDELEKRNTEVLSPWTKEVVPETIGTDFILLKGQELYNERDSWRHKYDHMNKFKKADAIIVCNPNGRIGKGTMFEFGFMTAFEKRIIFTNEPTELSIIFPYEVGLNF